MAPDRKSLIASRSFGRPIETLNEMEEAVASYASRAAEKMRRQDLSTANLGVFIETNPFKKQDRQYRAHQSVQLPITTSDTGRLVSAALAGLRRIWREGYRYKKAGVMLLDLVPALQIQGSLFAAPDPSSSHARMRVLDTINRRYGRGTLVIGSAGFRSGWKLRRDHLSNNYTTSWSELLKV